MATDHNHHAHHDVAYERTDLSHRGVWAFFAFLAISAAVIFIAMGALYKGFNYAEAKLAPPPNPMSDRPAASKPDTMMNTTMVDIQKFSANGTQPLLQSNDVADMDTFLRQENTLLTAAPWKDDKGNVHIPIDQAMKLVAQRSLPARANGANPAAPNPMTVPGESGFEGHAIVQQQADAYAAGEEFQNPERKGQVGPEGEKPETHSITPSAKRNPEMPEKKK